MGMEAMGMIETFLFAAAAAVLAGLWLSALAAPSAQPVRVPARRKRNVPRG